MFRSAVVVLLVSLPRIAAACSCAGFPSVDAAFQAADFVFAGIVEKIEDPAGDRIRALPESERTAANRARPVEWGPRNGLKVTFRVMQWWKGEDLPRTIELWTGYGGGDCGYVVEEGKSYLIFARRTSYNLLAFGLCSRTAALVCANEDVAALGDPIRTFESFDRDGLIAREQPYGTRGRPCIQPPILLTERGLNMDRHCRVAVEGVVDREGSVRAFSVKPRTAAALRLCPADAEIIEAVGKWKFRPGTIDGVPIEIQLSWISMRDPAAATPPE